jgi:hypothetical protein
MMKPADNCPNPEKPLVNNWFPPAPTTPRAAGAASVPALPAAVARATLLGDGPETLPMNRPAVVQPLAVARVLSATPYL